MALSVDKIGDVTVVALGIEQFDAAYAEAFKREIAPALSQPDAYGGIGRARFDLSLCKNRRGPSGRWIIEWDHHERAFQPALSVGVAAPALDRPDRAPLVRAG